MQGKRDKVIGWSAIITGTLLSVVVSVLLAAGLAVAQMNGWIEDRGVVIAAAATQVISAFVGATYAKSRANGGVLVACVLTGTGYCVCLAAITALFFRAQYQGALAHCLFVLGMATSVGLLGKRQQGRRKKRPHYKGFFDLIK